ncbi:MAG: two-component system response regulator [Mariniblastus sp.]
MTTMNTSGSTTTNPTPQASVNEELVQPQTKGNVVDRVFTQIGFDQLFLDRAQPPKRPHVRPKNLSAPLILHVDDDVDLVDAVTSRLRANGYRVASALDGVSGMQSTILYPANAIILDYDMPNGRGDIVIDLLKANSHTKNIPIVVLTAVHKKGLKRNLLNKGADVFMTKPFEFDELQQTLSDLITASNS